MYITAAKPNKHPSMSVGEQEVGNWNTAGGGTSSYKANNGAMDTRYDGARSKTLSLSGGSGKKNKYDYPKSRTKFGTEK